MSTAGQGMAGERVSLEISADPAMIALARLFVASVARHHACDEDVVDDLKIVVSEACTNAVKVHRDAKIDEPVTIAAAVQDDLLIFEVLDEGPGIDLSLDAMDGNAMTPSAGLYEGSLGLQMIRSLFPKSEIQRRGERGTVVRIPIPTGPTTDE